MEILLFTPFKWVAKTALLYTAAFYSLTPFKRVADTPLFTSLTSIPHLVLANQNQPNAVPNNLQLDKD